jgi:hypothetical protein
MSVAGVSLSVSLSLSLGLSISLAVDQEWQNAQHDHKYLKENIKM